MKKIAFTQRKADTSPLKECIEEFLKSTKIQQKFQETKVTAFWEDIMGKTIASRTAEVFLKNNVLYLRLKSAPLKNELSMAKGKMIDLLNKEMGADTVKDIIFM